MLHISSLTMAVAVAASILLCGLAKPSEALAQVATDLDCDPDGCVDSLDLANGSINRWDLTTVNSNAITSSEIKDGSILPRDLALNAFSSAYIADGSIQSFDLAPDSVNSFKLLDGSVQLQDLHEDVITAINVGNSEGKVFAHTFIVQSGFNAVVNCDQLKTALDAISGEANSYNLVYVEPGRYECFSVITVPINTALVGGGRNKTTLVGMANPAFILSDNSEVRGLTFVVEDDIEGAVLRVGGNSDVIIDKVNVAALGASLQKGVHIIGSSAQVSISDTSIFIINGNGVLSIAGNSSITVVTSLVDAEAFGSALSIAANDSLVVNSSEIFGAASLVAKAPSATARCFGSWNFKTLNPIDAFSCN